MHIFYTTICLVLLWSLPLFGAHAGGDETELKQENAGKEMQLAQTAPIPEDEAAGVNGETPEPEVPVEEEILPETTTEEEEEKEEELPPEPEDEPIMGEPGEGAPAATDEEKILGPKKVTIDAVIYVDYQFYDSPDAFKVKYHLNMGGNANLSAALIKGDAEIATEVTGYLSKWPEGQCLLNVNISKVPYEIQYRQEGGEADINVRFKKDISERWESTCTFLGGARPFKTEGPSEKWISSALEKTAPPLSSIVAPLEADVTSSTTFDIPEYTVVEENLGNAKVKGTGVVTIQPLKSGAKGGKPPTSYRFTPPERHEAKRELVKRTHE